MFCTTQSVKVLSNPGKVKFEGLVHVLRYIRDSTNLLLKYYANIEDANISDLFIKASIKTDNQFMVLSDSIWQDCTDTGRSKEAYIVFYQGLTIDNFTHLLGAVYQSSDDSE